MNAHVDVSKVLAWVDNLPRLRLTAQEFKDLGEYSCSMPTGVTPGKRWKALLGDFDQAFIRAGGKPRWVIREYQLADDPKFCRTVQFKPVVIVKAAKPLLSEGYELFEGKPMKVLNGDRSGWWRFHNHYDRDGYCDNPARGY